MDKKEERASNVEGRLCSQRHIEQCSYSENDELFVAAGVFESGVGGTRGRETKQNWVLEGL